VQRIEQLIGLGASEGAGVPVDGRGTSIKGYENGYFVRPTILTDVQPGSEIWKTEIFGPVLSLMHVNTIDDAIALTNSHVYGNQASLFTSSGAAARKFRYEADAGILASILVWRPRWRSSRSRAGRSHSLATCTGRAWMRLSSSPRRRWWWSAGRRSGAGSSKKVIPFSCYLVDWLTGKRVNRKTG
jgi:hypothetical protein